MSLVKRNTVFPSLLNEILNTDWYGGLENNTSNTAPVNIKENEKDYTLELLAPGREKEDFNIEIDKNILSVSVLDEKVKTDVNEKFSLKEFSVKSFKRTFSLPDTINEDSINVTYKNGVLKFTLPKKEEALPKPKRLIEIA
ncbi:MULTISPECIES: Hsp20/alpha crystallin family protein [Cellulophaga]|uniref:Heat shock protein Hsp20 n=2 Tax=Cellulophaga TaxID=104264 RepID=F0RFX6_CELLC|nr:MULTISPECIES: Hsp20/alpha crystallin family protein [Cellulophaga]ADY27936.1 heat shock protein Hsp20 [Cellulophaga lytica DSM 7489]AIM59016.1 molecular chaperone Hsp20 [Cellulophaga lytica]EWH14091.1 heat shock protein Hsp20 [Cellulophaga geojensis KL-A]TVZ09495.1 HSP20 family protein [Cellulophaga sp. RHA_52]WQG77874.1 Hsp20/alpha crystallin family protein [Cellulophaga lytica]